VVRGVGASPWRNLRYVLVDPEPHNLTYELANEEELAVWVAAVGAIERERAEALIGEARADHVLAARVRGATARRRLWSKRSPPFGRRLAWYALARLKRPALVIETGVHDGLGALILLRALERNAQEGAPGRLVSFDINPAAGWIVGSHAAWELRTQPALEGLPAVLRDGPEIGLFIHDSLHTYENERGELELAAAALASDGVLVSDNAHGSPALIHVCTKLGMQYFGFHERPADHFYTGGAMGAGRR
jgi:Methyltransferase domain